jgi:GNAT superfamily N-acetyltransferase
MEARIRPATTGDLFWLRLLLGKMHEGVEVYPAMTTQDLEAQTAVLASRLGSGDPSLLCYVAESEDVVGGFVLGDLMTRMGQPRCYLFVSYLYVNPAWRASGVGRGLSLAIINAGRDNGAEALEFTEQAGDTQWFGRGWPAVATVYSLPMDAAHASVVPTSQERVNGHA